MYRTFSATLQEDNREVLVHFSAIQFTLATI